MTENAEHHNLVPIYVCEDDGEAEIIVEFLASNDINAMIDSNVPHSTLPVAEDARILVHEDDAEEAKRLLNEHKNMPKEEETAEEDA